jgi:hypothetical protein
VVLLCSVRRARLSFLCAGLAAVWLSATPARAQEASGAAQAPSDAAPLEGSEEVIADPELGSAATETPLSSEEAIVDPELSGLAQSRSTATLEPNGDVRVVLHSRLAVDTQWQGPYEDVWESTNVALFEARVRRSENLRFSVGLRARYMFAARQHDTADADAARYELDVAPTAAFADVTPADGLHFRIGYQSVVLGRFDVLNASDILSTYDLRSGMTTMAEANEIAQPAVRMDWDIGSWLGLTAIVLPFFEPYRIHLVDGDYAIAPITGASEIAANTQMTQPPLTQAQQQLQEQQQQLMRLQRTTLSRSGQALVEDSAFYAFAPAPSFTHPQAALRLNAHDAAGELGFTAGIAREHLPAPHYSDAFLRFVDAVTFNMNGGMAMLPSQAELSGRPIGFDYDPFELLSLDAATAFGPVQVGVEAAYMFHRTFLSSPTGMPDPMHLSELLGRAEHTDLAHAGLRAEYTQGSWVVVLEGAIERAMQLPGTGQRYAFMADGRWLLSSVGFVSFTPGDIGLTLELGGALLNGPTYAFLPRAEQRLFSDFFVEAGAYFLGGKHYLLGDPRATLGSLYDNIDQVFIGLRWLP